MDIIKNDYDPDFEKVQAMNVFSPFLVRVS